MNSFSIGVSALAVSQQLINLTGQNIANANTAGYHRQVAELAPLQTDQTGEGVTVTGIRREVTTPLETALLNNTYESQDTNTQLDNLRQVQSYLAPGTGGINTLLSSFFNDVQTLAASPTDQAQRSVVL